MDATARTLRGGDGMSLREEQCKKVCRILDNVLANRPTERDSLIVAAREAFKALAEPYEPQITSEAIDALSADGDTISRQAAIEALNRECCCGAVIDHCGLETAMDIIKELQPTQPERITSRWIPCGERPPENDNDVLVQMNDGSMMVDYRAASSNGWFWAELDDEPVAWMPLPEPYKEVTE